jgi:hypothetical protein
MASVVSAIVDRWNSLTAVNFPSASRPPIYLDRAPATTSTGTQLRPPYAVLRVLDAREQILDTGMRTLTRTTFSLELFYPSLADADTAAHAARFNGGAFNARQGFDWGSLDAWLPTGQKTLILRPVGEPRQTAGTDRDGHPVHSVRLTYTATVVRG